MAKCLQCGNSGPFLKLTDGICDKCTISNLRRELIKSHDMCKQLESLLLTRTNELASAKAEIDRLTSERVEILFERNQLVAMSKEQSFAHSFREPDINSDYYSPDGQEFKRRIMESLSHMHSSADRAATLELKIERYQKYIELFDQSADACKLRGSDFANWFHELYVSKHDHRKYACDRLDECTVQMNATVSVSNAALDDLGNILISIIGAEDGILQRDLGKRFDVSIRNHLRNLLYQMEQVGAISREKSGSSYALHLVNGGATFTLLTRKPEGDLQDDVKYCRFCSTLRAVYENGVCSVCRHSVW